MAFQILDDVLDITGPPERTGKPRGADVLDGTVTMPMILARQSDQGLAAIDLRGIRSPGSPSGIRAISCRRTASGSRATSSIVKCRQPGGACSTASAYSTEVLDQTRTRL